MELLQKFVRSRLFNLMLGIFLATIWVLFAWSHLHAYEESGEISFLIFAISETLAACLFMIRGTPQEVSHDPFSWLVAGGGTFVPLFVRPGGLILFMYGNVLLIFGVILQILSLLSLNTSFAIVAAKRGIKTQGLYRFVRHPMYASYLFLFSGYFLFNATLTNAAIIFMAFVFMFLRITEEEKILRKDAHYRSYTEVVKWKLVPFIY